MYNIYACDVYKLARHVPIRLLILFVIFPQILAYSSITDDPEIQGIATYVSLIYYSYTETQHFGAS